MKSSDHFTLPPPSLVTGTPQHQSKPHSRNSDKSNDGPPVSGRSRRSNSGTLISPMNSRASRSEETPLSPVLFPCPVVLAHHEPVVYPAVVHPGWRRSASATFERGAKFEEEAVSPSLRPRPVMSNSTGVTLLRSPLMVPAASSSLEKLDESNEFLPVVNLPPRGALMNTGLRVPAGRARSQSRTRSVVAPLPRHQRSSSQTRIEPDTDMWIPGGPTASVFTEDPDLLSQQLGGRDGTVGRRARSKVRSTDPAVLRSKATSTTTVSATPTVATAEGTKKIRSPSLPKRPPSQIHAKQSSLPSVTTRSTVVASKSPVTATATATSTTNTLRPKLESIAKKAAPMTRLARPAAKGVVSKP